MSAFDFPIFPDTKAHAVIAGLKWPPEILPPNAIAIAKEATIRRGVPVNDTAPIKRLVPKNSTKAGVYISIDYITEMKYLIVKGWLGFGDRLESLKMAVKYALHHNLQIYVDWTDSIWSHGDETFYTYFKLVNMPVLNSLDDIPADATFFPPYWKDNLKTSITQEIFDKRKELGINLGILNKPYEADVIVFSSIGHRSLFADSHFFANIFRVTDSRIRDVVIERQQKYNLSRCLGVHIRGTDRVVSQHKRELGIQYMSIAAVMSGVLSGKRMVSVSDDPISSEIWGRFHPQTVSLSSLSLRLSSQKGNHNVEKKDLSVSKDTMNVDMLIDFFTLCSCESILKSYKDSRFSKEAGRLHPFINIILS